MLKNRFLKCFSLFYFIDSRLDQVRLGYAGMTRALSILSFLAPTRNL